MYVNKECLRIKAVMRQGHIYFAIIHIPFRKFSYVKELKKLSQPTDRFKSNRAER